MNLSNYILGKNIDNTNIAIKNLYESISYKELYKLIIEISDKIQKDSERIYAIHMRNDINYIAFIFAAWSINKSVLCFPIYETIDDIISLMKKEGIKKIITDYKIDNELIKNKNNFINYSCGYIETIETNKEFKDIPMILKTSGTSKIDQYVLITRTMIISGLHQMVNEYSLTNDIVEMSCLPLTSASPFFGQVLPILFVGGIIITQNNVFTPLNISKSAELAEIDIMGITPTLLQLIIKNKKEYKDLKKIPTIIIGGELATRKFIEEAKEYFLNSEILNLYGLTETIIPITTYREYKDIKIDINSVGFLNKKVEYKVINSEEVISCKNKSGELLLKGPFISPGYLNTAREDADDWFYTGDIVYVNDERMLFIVGRKKELAIISGRNISLDKIKTVLEEIDGVQYAYVYSYENEITGEEIRAEILTNKAMSKESIILECRKKLKTIEIPKKIYFVNEIKLQGLGKVVAQNDKY